MNSLNTAPLYILGAGSIGLLLASSIRIKNPTIPVRLLLRSTQKHKLKTYGEELSIKKYIDQRIILRTSPKIPIVLLPSELVHHHHQQQQQQQQLHAHSYCNITQPFSSNDDTYVLVAMKSMGNDTINVIDIPAEIIQSEKVANEALISCMLLTTKAQDAHEALLSIAHRFKPLDKTQIIILSNGTLALLDELRMNHIQAQLVSACITHGANRGTESDFHQVDSIFGKNSCSHVLHAGIGCIYLEKKCPGVISDTLEALQTAGLHPDLLSEENMNLMHWKKLVANCTINPLTALRKVPNGQLITSSRNMELHTGGFHEPLYMDTNILSKLVHELSHVAQVESLSDSPNRTLSFDKLLGFVEEIIRKTAHNRSSMLQDIENKRITEIDYLNGYTVMLGRKHSIDMNVNEYIVEEIKGLERSFTS